MTQQALIGPYRSLRRKGYPAKCALDYARRNIETERTMASLGFEWRHPDHGCGQLTARWSQEGFQLAARIVEDEDGWWSEGQDVYGRFSDRWAPGAVPHRGGRRKYRWFIPADPARRHACYQAAVSYGRTWWYVGITVEAWRCGVKLADGSVWGIEYDLNDTGREQDLAAEALEIARTVIEEARFTLDRLCG